MRLRILAGAAASALMAGQAAAQALPADEPIQFSADNWSVDENDRTVLSGNVELKIGDGDIIADEAVLDPNTHVVSARGDIEIHRRDDWVEFADSLIFDEDFQTGVATNYAGRYTATDPTQAPQSATLAAANLIQRDANFAELNRAIFTTCELCDETGADKIPTWSIQADKIVRDEAKQSINYQNAIVRIKGVPVLYTPFFSHADPSVDRKSGLLSPDFQHTDRRGLTYEQPVLWAISPYQDLIVSPQFNTEVAPFLNLDWRRRFYTGLVQAQLGYTYERDFNTNGAKFGNRRSKAYILADGEFEVSPEWDWGFTAEAARDRRLFDQYSINYQRPNRGLFAADDRRLISQVYTVRQSDRSYLSLAAMSFQSLRPLPGPAGPFGVQPLEDNDTLPFVAPVVEFRYEPNIEVAGGRLRLGGSGVVLERDESPTILGAPGIDSRRATAEADWRRTFTMASGIRLTPFASARGDLYQARDLSPLDTDSRTSGRANITAGLDMSWPLIRMDGAVTTVIEPIVQIALSPDTDLDPDIPIEDSLAFQFDDTNLFEANKFPGFDLYEGGQRLNVGVRATVDMGGGRGARFVVGQSFRADPEPGFGAQSGLSDTTSDWVAGAEVTPFNGLTAFARTRFDGFDLERVEAGFDADTDRAGGYLRYMRTTADYTGVPREDVEGAAQVFITNNWGIVGAAVRDLEQKVWRRRSLGAVYEDDCLRFEILYQRDNNPVLGAADSSSVIVRLTLATLGDAGYSDYSSRPVRMRR
jgi:LPS-assembly protein